MNIGFNRVELRLAPREVLRLYDPEGARVECLGGELWITQDQDLEDHFLAAKETLTLERSGLVLIHAQQPSEIALFEPAPRASWQRRAGRALAAATRALGRGLARIFGPESIDRPGPRAWLRML